MVLPTDWARATHHGSWLSISFSSAPQHGSTPVDFRYYCPKVSMDLPGQVARDTRTLLVATSLMAGGLALPFVLGEAAWGFGLLVAPVLLVAIGSLPVAVWASSRAIVSVLRGDDPRRWVLLLSLAVLLGSLVLILIVILRFHPAAL